jgi:DNA primase
MRRIPDEELAQLKREVALADLCRDYGIELKPHGADLVGLCPFHDDHEPSFVVTPAKNLEKTWGHI